MGRNFVIGRLKIFSSPVIFFFIIIFLFPTLVYAAGNYNETLAVRCSNGIFVGSEKNGAVGYIGVPYAKQPVGDLRWKAPEQPTPSDKIFIADKPSVMPLQILGGNKKFDANKIGEDCLKLNIWLNPNNHDKKKAVMVYFHGGAYMRGNINTPLLNGENFVRENDDVILIVVGYRLGMMGFIDLSNVEGGENFPDSACLGLLDQIQALRWINENIAAFGGDPENVTIFGHSAGGSSVSFLMSMPEARKYFNRCIAQSGTVFFSHSPQFCQRLPQELLRVSGAKNMDELMNLSTEELYNLMPQLGEYFTFPERDGKHLPSRMFEAFERGDTKKIDLLIGTTSDEWRLWLLFSKNMQDFHANTLKVIDYAKAQLPPKDLRLIDKFMARQYGESVWKDSELLDEIIFNRPAFKQADLHSAAGGKTFVYHWKYKTGSDETDAFHGAELVEIFGNPIDNYRYKSYRYDAALAKKVQRMWVNFAKTGNPSTEDFVWPQYDRKHRATVVFDNEIFVERDLEKAGDLLTPLMDLEFDMLVK